MTVSHSFEGSGIVEGCSWPRVSKFVVVGVEVLVADSKVYFNPLRWFLVGGSRPDIAVPTNEKLGLVVVEPRLLAAVSKESGWAFWPGVQRMTVIDYAA
ncbi:hypothetical protein ColKHC_14314 [Colletotrichum higginsianum]|nr:hypothetical protein ColKHC_14314 [Colletotrichum higginsianum]